MAVQNGEKEVRLYFWKSIKGSCVVWLDVTFALSSKEMSVGK